MAYISLYIRVEIFNADIVIREDISVEQFIDVVLGNRRYINCIYVSIFFFHNNINMII